MGCGYRRKRILRLIGMMLRSGIMVNGVVKPSEEGTMQGGHLASIFVAGETILVLLTVITSVSNWNIGFDAAYVWRTGDSGAWCVPE